MAVDETAPPLPLRVGGGPVAALVGAPVVAVAAAVAMISKRLFGGVLG